jgi:hypothetical protein
MSLKWFHVLFITLSTLVLVGFGVWGLFNQYVVLGVASILGSAGLCVYGTYFLQKMRRIFGVALLTIAMSAWATPAWACPVCFGAADSAMTKGMQAGIMMLLAVTVSVLGAVGAFFFIYLRRRLRMFEAATASGQQGVHGGSY